jgi:hypothetical protein
MANIPHGYKPRRQQKDADGRDLFDPRAVAKSPLTLLRKAGL